MGVHAETLNTNTVLFSQTHNCESCGPSATFEICQRRDGALLVSERTVLGIDVLIHLNR